MLQINFGAVALVTCLGFVVQIVGSHYLNGSVRYNDALVFLMQWGSSLLGTLAMAVLFTDVTQRLSIVLVYGSWIKTC